MDLITCVRPSSKRQVAGPGSQLTDLFTSRSTLDSKPDEDVAALVQGFHDRHRTAQQAVEAELSAFKASLGAVFASDASSSDGEDVTLELPPERPPCEQGSG